MKGESKGIGLCWDEAARGGVCGGVAPPGVLKNFLSGKMKILLYRIGEIKAGDGPTEILTEAQIKYQNL